MMLEIIQCFCMAASPVHTASGRRPLEAAPSRLQSVLHILLPGAEHLVFLTPMLTAQLQ